MFSPLLEFFKCTPMVRRRISRLPSGNATPFFSKQPSAFHSLKTTSLEKLSDGIISNLTIPRTRPSVLVCYFCHQVARERRLRSVFAHAQSRCSTADSGDSWFCGCTAANLQTLPRTSLSQDATGRHHVRHLFMFTESFIYFCPHVQLNDKKFCVV